MYQDNGYGYLYFRPETNIMVIVVEYYFYEDTPMCFLI